MIDVRTLNVDELKNINLDDVDTSVSAPEYEPHRQYYFMAKAREYVKELEKKLGRRPTCFTQTFGCPIV